MFCYNKNELIKKDKKYERYKEKTQSEVIDFYSNHCILHGLGLFQFVI